MAAIELIVESEVKRTRHSLTTYVVVHDGDKIDGTWWKIDGGEDEIEIHHSDKPQNWAHFERNDHGVWECNGSDSDYDDAIFEAIAAKLNDSGLPPWNASKS